eukprot:1220832-Amphidinium_carterae.1
MILSSHSCKGCADTATVRYTVKLLVYVCRSSWANFAIISMAKPLYSHTHKLQRSMENKPGTALKKSVLFKQTSSKCWDRWVAE